MRLNLYVAKATGLSRRAADEIIKNGQLTINGRPAKLGDQVNDSDSIVYGSVKLKLPTQSRTILLNKPIGYICSRNGQGAKTIYDLLPKEFQTLKPVGRLDKDSSGLILLTDDGQLAHQLTHPSFHKQKLYDVELSKPLTDSDIQNIQTGVELEDGPSRLQLKGQANEWQVSISEGRNRQIRRTFQALGYKVIKLHRKQFGDYKIGQITEGNYLLIE